MRGWHDLCFGVTLVLMMVSGGRVGADPPAAKTTGEPAAVEPADEPMKPTEAALRWTPAMSRAVGECVVREIEGRGYELDDKAKHRIVERFARRYHTMICKHQREGKPLLEEVLVEVLRNGLAFSEGAAQPWMKLCRLGLADMRQCVLATVEDIRPLIPAQDQLRFTRDTIGVVLWVDAMEKKFSRWEKGDIRPREGPFITWHDLQQVKLTADWPGLDSSADRCREEAKEYIASMTGKWWGEIVEAAVKMYQLDDEQKAVAQSILKELRERAAQTMTQDWRRRAVRARMKVAVAERVRDEGYCPWAWPLWWEFNELGGPIWALRRELQRRLDKLPTQAQRESAMQEYHTIARKVGLE